MPVECNKEEEGPGGTLPKGAATSGLGKRRSWLVARGKRRVISGFTTYIREFEKVLLRSYSSCETLL